MHDLVSAYILIGFMLLFVPDNILKSLHVFMYPYFVAGYLWGKHNGVGHYRLLSTTRKLLIVFTCAAFFVFFFQILVPEHSVYLNGTCLLERNSVAEQFYIDLCRYVWGFDGVVILLIIVDLVNCLWHEGWVRCLLTALGKNTLGIYATHNYTISAWLFLPVSSSACLYLLNLAESCITLAVCYLISCTLKRNKLTNILFLGSR